VRVERALEGLRGLLAKRGVTTAAALASVISVHAVLLHLSLGNLVALFSQLFQVCVV
jgi:hypothetical protein